MDYGILYAYLKVAIFENNEYAMDIVDTLRYNTHDFFQNIERNLKLENESSEEIKITNLFCICSNKQKINQIQGKIVKQIINQISNGNEFKDNKDIYSNYINIFVNYIIENQISPLIFKLDIDEELSVLYFFGSNQYYEQPPQEIKDIVSIWISREQPYLLGKQIITQPFFYKNLVNRKSLDIVSNYNSDDLYLLLEGNIKIKLDYHVISSLSYTDTHTFHETDIQKILYDPIYCFGYTFEYSILFMEWMDIYLYVLAILDVDIKDEIKLKKSYQIFLKFIEDNICTKIYADKPILNEDCFYPLLKLQIEEIKKILSGKEEINISKNFLYTIDNRWTYLEVMFEIVEPIYKNEINHLKTNTKFDIDFWKSLLKEVNSSKNYEKGKAMEDLANYFLSCIEQIKITGRNARHFTEEIDLCICNYAKDSIFWNLGSLILVECKNHKRKIPVKTIRNLSYIMESKGITTTILFSKSELTKPALEEIRKSENLGKHFIIIYLKDLISIQDNPNTFFKKLLETKF